MGMPVSSLLADCVAAGQTLQAYWAQHGQSILKHPRPSKL
jgi:hypothetical protein